MRLFWDGQEYLRHHPGTDLDRSFAHPVGVPGQPPLTCFAPADHVWHAGFWFNWKEINGANYWENGQDGHPEGRTVFLGPERLEAEGDWVRLAARYAYVGPDRREVAREGRTLTWYRPDPDGSHRTDVAISLRAGETQVTLDRTPITEKTPWGGYAGLSWRFSRGFVGPDGLDAEGRRHRAIEHQRSRWAAMWGRLDGGPDIRAGVAMFDHPANPGHPTHWRYIADPGFAYLNPSPILAAPLRLPAGGGLELRYRVLVFPGTGNAGRLETEYARFAQSGA